MKTDREFLTTLTERDDAQLYEALAHESDYLPDAIQAVRAELRARKLSADRAAELQSAAEVKAAAERERQERSLKWFERALLLLFPLGLPAIMFLAYCQYKGYERKLSQAWPYIAASMVFWVLVMAGMKTTADPALSAYWMVLPLFAVMAAGVFLWKFRPEPIAERAADTPGLAAAQCLAASPVKSCVSCGEAIRLDARTCPACGWTQPA